MENLMGIWVQTAMNNTNSFRNFEEENWKGVHANAISLFSFKKCCKCCFSLLDQITSTSVPPLGMVSNVSHFK
jgi:hypothetical protein